MGCGNAPSLDDNDYRCGGNPGTLKHKRAIIRLCMYCCSGKILVVRMAQGELFTLPPFHPSEFTALSVPELPAQNVVTGDQELDAVLWLRQVIMPG